MKESEALLRVAERLRDRLEALSFSAPVAYVYDPLVYAWRGAEAYARRFGDGKGRVMFLGMNPGPWGMAQTGVPFGEVHAARDWLGIDVEIGHPAPEHPRYPVRGFSCARSEISGKRLWGLFRERFGTAEAFFRGHYVANWCPLLFLERTRHRGGGDGARNLTPDKLRREEREALYAACDDALRESVEILSPSHVVGVGGFAARRAEAALAGRGIPVCRILHPSPASPRSNRDWPGEAARELTALGIWDA